MIGRLRGLVAEIETEDALIDVMGVGYVVRCGARTLSRLPAVGEEAVLHIESQYSQDAGTRLYGFLTREERSVFRLLQSIQGVGPKAALGVLDVLAPGELASAVAREDKAAIGRANGVGPKLALRILTELKGKPLGAGFGGGNSKLNGARPTGHTVRFRRGDLRPHGSRHRRAAGPPRGGARPRHTGSRR